MAQPAFDPDQYLAEKGKLLASAPPPQATPQAFDPDQYLAEKGAAPAMPGTSVAQTALEHGANAAAMGYLPQLQAAAEPVTNAIGNLGIMAKNVFSKDKQPLVQADPYVEARDANIKRQQAQAQANPGTALASDVGGAVVGGMATPIPGLGAAKGLIGGAVKGAAGGAVQAFAQNPGDVEGQVSPLQAGDRLENAKRGGIIGGIAGGTGEAVRKGLNNFSKVSPALKNVAENVAFKSSGAMLKDFRAAAGHDEVNDLGRFMIDNKLAKAGNTYHDVYDGAVKIKDQAGKDLEQVYNKALDTIKDPNIAKNMPGFNPVQDKEKLIALVKTKLGDAVEAKSAVAKINDYIDGLAEKYGDRALDPKTQNDIKGAIDKQINYTRNPLSKQPDQEQALKAARTYLSSKIDSSIDFLGKAAGDESALAKLKDANKRYGSSTSIANIADDRISRESANRMFGLTDTIAGAAGAAAGTTAAAATGGDIKHQAGIGLLATGAGMLANKGARKYGPGLISGAAEAGSRATAPLSGGAGMLGKAIPNAGLIGRVAASRSLEEKRK